MNRVLAIVLNILILSGCETQSSNSKKSEFVQFEKIDFYNYPKDSVHQPFSYRITNYYENGKPHKWLQLDSLEKIDTEYIYLYDSTWNHIGAQYREDGDPEFSLEKVRFINDSTQVTEWIDSIGDVYYTMTDFLNESGKTISAEFKGTEVHGYDSTFYTEEGFVSRIFFTNNKGKIFNDRSFTYDSVNVFGDWVIRNKVMNDTIREIQIRQIEYDKEQGIDL